MVVTMGKSCQNGWFGGIYPLVNVDIAMENQHSWWENSRTKCWFSSSLCEITNVRDSIVYIYIAYTYQAKYYRTGTNGISIFDIWYVMIFGFVMVCPNMGSSKFMDMISHLFLGYSTLCSHKTLFSWCFCCGCWWLCWHYYCYWQCCFTFVVAAASTKGSYALGSA